MRASALLHAAILNGCEGSGDENVNGGKGAATRAAATEGNHLTAGEYVTKIYRKNLP